MTLVVDQLTIQETKLMMAVMLAALKIPAILMTLETLRIVAMVNRKYIHL